jgi:hypothetical protein
MSIREKPAGTLSLAQVLERLAALESKIAEIARNRRGDEAIQRACYSVRDFCIAHCISEDMFFKMQRQGRAPKTMKVGARTLISMESAAEWRRQCEAAENPVSDGET